ncbi:MAG: DUF488 family protein [Micrococcales bacterium]|nr:DUF488 family protein [Micrococcales bacterium]
MPAPAVRIKRVYDAASPDDGFRVLVDRLWPRGMTRERAAADLWLKDVAPSPALRTAWHHTPDRFEQFADRYRAELDTNPAADRLLGLIRSHPAVTLLFAAHDPEANHAAVLRGYLADALARGCSSDAASCEGPPDEQPW